MINPLTKSQQLHKKPKKKLEKECMSFWQEIVKLKAGNRCEYWGCHKTEHLNAHHIFPRSRQSTRYDIDNGMCLCSGHHSLLAESAHKDPEFLNKVLGKVDGYKPIRTEQWFTLLRRRAYTPQKLDLEMELIYLKKTLQETLVSSLLQYTRKEKIMSGWLELAGEQIFGNGKKKKKKKSNSVRFSFPPILDTSRQNRTLLLRNKNRHNKINKMNDLFIAITYRILAVLLFPVLCVVLLIALIRDPDKIEIRINK